MDHLREHGRRSIRLPGWDYSWPAWYFVTICTEDWVCTLGAIERDKMILSRTGRIVDETWCWLAKQYEYVELSDYVVMPNHIHGIIIIKDKSRRGGSRTAPTDRRPAKPLGRLIGAFKTVSTRRVNEIRKTPGRVFWQRNYHEHVIRNDADLRRIREYIANNPMNWALDEENPAKVVSHR